MTYNLDTHGEELLQQYRERLSTYQRIEQIASEQLQKALQENGLYVTSIEHRIKTEASLAGKLELKGAKYKTLSDITDIMGMRIITFYTDDVEKVAAIARHTFDIDWKESVDKRKHQLNSFGYNSLHYICRIPQSLFHDPTMPNINEYRFEIQMRTALQHVWSTMEHDIGYKSDVKIPIEYLRQLSRLAGMLELADDEFSRLRSKVSEYQRNMQNLVTSGKLNEVALNENTFRQYLAMKPFDRLNQSIAAVNQAEIVPTPLLPYLRVLRKFGFETLADVEHFIADNYDDALQLALSQLAITDLDILSANIGVQNLCIVHILKNGEGRPGLKNFYHTINGDLADNDTLADITLAQAASLPFYSGHQ